MRRIFTILIVLTSLQSIGQIRPTDTVYVLANQPKNDSNKLKALYYLTLSMLQLDKYDSSVYYNNLQRKLALHLNWNKGRIGYLNSTSKILSRSRNYSQALQTLFEALKMAEKTGDKNSEGSLYISIGQIYYETKDYKETLLNYGKAIDLYKETERNSDESFYSDLADAFYNFGNLDSALFYQNKALQMSLKSKNKTVEAIAFCNLGNIYYKLEKFDIADAFYRRGLEGANLINFKALKAEILLGIANVFHEIKKIDSAIVYNRQSIIYSQRSASLNKEIEGLQLIKDLFKEKRSFDSVAKYQDLLINAKDSLYSNDEIKKIETARIAEIYRQQQLIEIKEDEKENRKRKIQTSFIAMFIPFFGGIVYLIGSRKRKNSKIIGVMAICTILMLFEFISFVLHPTIEKVTNHVPILMYLTLLSIALALAPLHHKLMKVVKSKL
jgi:tetratricopeptide (TPR) repeat protein